MKIWIMLASDDTISLDYVEDDPEYTTSVFQGHPITEWKRMKLKAISKSKNDDFLYFSGGAPVFSMKTLEILKPLLNDTTELLDVEIIKSKKLYKIVNVLNVIDAIDITKSIAWRGNNGTLKSFKKVVFKIDCVDNQHIFKTPEFMKTNIYVSDTFRNIVIEAGLKGFDFTEMWDSEDTEEKELAAQDRYESYLMELEHNKGEVVDWSSAIEWISQDRAVASGPWKIQNDHCGSFMVGKLNMECKYEWSNSFIIPPMLLGLMWYEVDKSDL